MTAEDAVIALLSDANPVGPSGPRSLDERAEADRVLRRVFSSPAAGPHIRGWRRVLGGSGIALAAAVAGVVAAIAIVALGHGHPGGGQATSESGARGGRSALAGSFAVFRRRRRAADVLPSARRFTANNGVLDVEQQYHVDPALSRLVIATPTLKIWLVPGHGYLAEVEVSYRQDRISQVTAGVTSQVQAERLGMARFDRAQLVAVLPQGSSPVKVTLRDGSVTFVRANLNGAILQTFRQPVRSIAYNGPTGAHQGVGVGLATTTAQRAHDHSARDGRDNVHRRCASCRTSRERANCDRAPEQRHVLHDRNLEPCAITAKAVWRRQSRAQVRILLRVRRLQQPQDTGLMGSSRGTWPQHDERRVEHPASLWVGCDAVRDM